MFLGAAPRDLIVMQHGACGMMVQVTSVFALSMQNKCKYSHDDTNDSDAACLFIRVFKMVGTAEGGNGRTPSAASISLPSSVASNLHLESGTNVYASYTCNASVPRGFLAPVSIPRSAYLFPRRDMHVFNGTKRVESVVCYGQASQSMASVSMA